MKIKKVSEAKKLIFKGTGEELRTYLRLQRYCLIAERFKKPDQRMNLTRYIQLVNA